MDGELLKYINGREENERNIQETAEEDDLCGRRINTQTDRQANRVRHVMQPNTDQSYRMASII